MNFKIPANDSDNLGIIIHVLSETGYAAYNPNTDCIVVDNKHPSTVWTVYCAWIKHIEFKEFISLYERT